MELILILAAFAALASDPCTAPSGHQHGCRAAVYGPASKESKPLDQYKRHEFGVVGYRRVEPPVEFTPPPLPATVSEAWSEVGGSVCVMAGNCGGSR